MFLTYILPDIFLRLILILLILMISTHIWDTVSIAYRVTLVSEQSSKIMKCHCRQFFFSLIIGSYLLEIIK